jgi:hypothetical protein
VVREVPVAKRIGVATRSMAVAETAAVSNAAVSKAEARKQR